MKMIFTGKVSGEKTVLTAGARHTVKAQAGEQYGLVDEVTGLVPDGVEADRSGDDLILRKKEDDTEIRIEGFWEECQPGETQCTAVFNVVGENGQVTEAVLTQDGPVLENFTAGQSGTLVEGINNGIIWGGLLLVQGWRLLHWLPEAVVEAVVISVQLKMSRSRFSLKAVRRLEKQMYHPQAQLSRKVETSLDA
ncbi:hypothetical protein OHC87_18120 [Escherichia coli]|nr:hypothetical protein [Escherichia coli]MCW3434811.1 hypothetical protein [Escherichia coli]MCW7119167.1 hypothetical protein [Escherichia coli]